MKKSEITVGIKADTRIMVRQLKVIEDLAKHVAVVTGEALRELESIEKGCPECGCLTVLPLSLDFDIYKGKIGCVCGDCGNEYIRDYV